MKTLLDKHRSRKRRVSDGADGDDEQTTSASSEIGNTDNKNSRGLVNIPVSFKGKRALREDTPEPESRPCLGSHTERNSGRSKKYNAEDFRAAQLLLNLCMQDAQPEQPEVKRGEKRKLGDS